MGRVQAKRRSRGRSEPVSESTARATTQSEDSVSRILHFAALILQDVGVEGFNTNEISKRSGVPIGAIYHHFANKEAIVRELCARWLDRVTDRYNEFEALERRQLDDTSFWLLLVERLYHAYKETVGLRAITRATEIWPDVHELEVNYDELVVARVTSYLLELGVEVSRKEQRRISILILNMMHYCLLLSAGSSVDAHANIADLAHALGDLTSRHRKGGG